MTLFVRALPASVVLLAVIVAAAGCDRERTQLLADAKNDRPEIRAGAIHRLGELANSQDLGLFITKAQDASPKVRGAVAGALGHFPDQPRATDALSSLLADPDDEVESLAAKSLAGFGTEKARAYLEAAFSRRGSATRAAIAEALGMSPVVADAVRKEADGIRERNLKALEDGSSAEKVGAAEELGRSGRSDAVERLLPMLGNDSILLAAGAARGLGAAGDRKAVPALIAVLKQNDLPLREASAQALGELGDPQALSVLAPLSADSDAASPDAAEALTKLPPSPDVNAALCAAASSSNSSTAVAAAARAMSGRGGCPTAPVVARLGKGAGESRLALLALQKLGSVPPEAAAKVTPLLDDKDPSVRLEAIATLGAIGGPTAGAALLALAKSAGEKLDRERAKWVKDPLPKVFAAGINRPVIEAGADFGTKLSTLYNKVHANDESRADEAGQQLHVARQPAAVEIIPDTDPDEVKQEGATLAALGRAHPAGAEEVLLPRAADTDEDIRNGALVGLAYAGDPTGLKAIASGWADLSAEAVETVAAALRTLGAPAVPTLLAGLKARDSDRGPIAEALGAIRSPEAEAPLEKLLGAGGAESAEAATALAELGQPGGAKALVDALHDSRFPAQLAAVEALGKLKDAQGREALTRELFSDQTEVRTAAVKAIAALGVGPSSAALEALRGDYYREVRHAVEQALGAAPAGH